MVTVVEGIALAALLGVDAFAYAKYDESHRRLNEASAAAAARHQERMRHLRTLAQNGGSSTTSSPSSTSVTVETPASEAHLTPGEGTAFTSSTVDTYAYLPASRSHGAPEATAVTFASPSSGVTRDEIAELESRVELIASNWRAADHRLSELENDWQDAQKHSKQFDEFEESLSKLHKRMDEKEEKYSKDAVFHRLSDAEDRLSKLFERVEGTESVFPRLAEVERSLNELSDKVIEGFTKVTDMQETYIADRSRLDDVLNRLDSLDTRLNVISPSTSTLVIVPEQAEKKEEANSFSDSGEETHDALSSPSYSSELHAIADRVGEPEEENHETESPARTNQVVVNLPPEIMEGGEAPKPVSQPVSPASSTTVIVEAPGSKESMTRIETTTQETSETMVPGEGNEEGMQGGEGDVQSTQPGEGFTPEQATEMISTKLSSQDADFERLQTLLWDEIDRKSAKLLRRERRDSRKLTRELKASQKESERMLKEMAREFRKNNRALQEAVERARKKSTLALTKASRTKRHVEENILPAAKAAKRVARRAVRKARVLEETAVSAAKTAKRTARKAASKARKVEAAAVTVAKRTVRKAEKKARRVEKKATATAKKVKKASKRTAPRKAKAEKKVATQRVKSGKKAGKSSFTKTTKIVKTVEERNEPSAPLIRNIISSMKEENK